VIGRYQSTWSTQVPRGRNQDDDLELDLDNLDPPGDEPNGDQDDDSDQDDEGSDRVEDDDQDDDRDDDRDDDQPDDQDDDGGEPEDRQPDRRQPDRRASRRDPRIQALTEDNRRERQRSADLERRLNDLTSRVNNGSNQPRETPEQRAARLSLMTPEDRLREEFRESNETHNGQMRAMAFTLQDNSDRSSYEAKAARIPLYSKWADRVEEEVRKQRDNGVTVPREAVLYYLIGKQAVAGLNSPENRQERRAAARRVRRQTTRPSNSRSDAQPDSNTRQRQSVEKRLENIPL